MAITNICPKCGSYKMWYNSFGIPCCLRCGYEDYRSVELPERDVQQESGESIEELKVIMQWM